MKVLVTGAYGQLGSELKEKSVDYPGWKFLFTDIDTLDITGERGIKEYFQKKQPEFVINCAAYTAVDQAEDDHILAERVNSKAPGLLAKEANRVDAGFVHISTDYVYGGEAFVPYTEMDNAAPVTIYGRTKLKGERLCLEANPDSVIIRTSWLYSSYGNNFVKTILQSGKINRQVKVVYDQAGTPTWASDLADTLFLIIEKFAENRQNVSSGIYNYSNEGVTSWFDFAKAVYEISDINSEVIPVLSSEFPTRAVRPHYSVLDKSKIKAAFGLKIPYWRDSLKKCLTKIQNIR